MEKERERSINVWLPLLCPLQGTARNPGTCLNWESNQQPLGSQVSAPSTEPHQPGQFISLLLYFLLYSIVSLVSLLF